MKIKIILITDIRKWLAIITFDGNDNINYRKVNCTLQFNEILIIENIIKNYLLLKYSIELFNLSLFINNISVKNNSRTNYYSIRHLIKLICEQNNIKYIEKFINTNHFICNKKKIRNIKITFNKTNDKNNETHSIKNNIQLINLIKKNTNI